METEVLQENLSKAISLASRFASSRAQLPVLGNILLSASKTKLLICSTNLETSVAISLGAKVKEEGDLTIPAKIIFEVVSNLQSGVLSLKSEKEHLKISSSGFSSRISGMNASDFPKIPQSLSKGSIALPKKDLLASLIQVSFAVSSDEARPILTGVLFIFSKGALSMVATDGFRLSKKRIRIEGVSESRRVVLPKNILLEISRLGEEGEEMLLEVREKDSQVLFGVDNAVLSSRVLEGEFPDFEKIIPKESTIKVRLDKEEFLRAIKLSAPFARDSANIVRILILKDSIKISAESSQSGNQETTVDAKTEGLSSKDFEIAFNYKFLEDFLKSVLGEEVLMEFNNPSSPGVFTDPKDPDYLHLIMPVKVQA